MAHPMEETTNKCDPASINYGEKWEQKMAQYMQWFSLITSVLILLWYAKQMMKKLCGWEEFYVCLINSKQARSCPIGAGVEFSVALMLP